MTIPAIHSPVADAGATLTVFGAIVGVLPKLAAVVGMILYGLLIYDWIEARLRQRRNTNGP